MEQPLVDLLSGKVEIKGKIYNLYGPEITGHPTRSVGIIIGGYNETAEVIYNPDGLEVYFYKSTNRSGFKYSRYYKDFVNMPEKYFEHLERAKEVYQMVFQQNEEEG